MRKCNKKGFTLVELIVVIGILVVLAAILIPVVSGYVNDSKETTCYADRNTIIRAYKAQYALRRAHGQDISVENVLADCKSTFPGATISGSAVMGVCPSGGKYTCTSTAEGEVTIVCDKHSAGHVYTTEEIGDEFKKALDSFTLENSNIYSTIQDANYNNLLANLPDGIKAMLAGKSWAYDKGAGKLYVADVDITQGTPKSATVYDLRAGSMSTTKNVYKGTKKIGGVSYPVLAWY